MDYSPPGSYVHGISQARKLEWVAMSFSREFLLYNEVIQLYIYIYIPFLILFSIMVYHRIFYLFFSFCDWFILLSMSSRFIHIVGCVRISFLFKVEKYCAICLYHILFIRPIISEPLSAPFLKNFPTVPIFFIFIGI